MNTFETADQQLEFTQQFFEEIEQQQDYRAAS
jgi:hypothetical protein